MEKAHTFAVETYQKRLDEDREQETTAARELEEIHLNTASIRQKAEFTASNLNRVDSELRRLREEERQLTENREQAEEDTRSREAGIGALKQEMEALKAKVTGLEEKTARAAEAEGRTVSFPQIFLWKERRIIHSYERTG